VTAVVVEIGPSAIRGVGPVDAQTAALAIDCVDDGLALLDDEPVAVTELWSSVLAAAVGQHARRAVLVVPTGWPQRRVDVVVRAARAAVADVVAITRHDALAAPGSAMVEVGPELVVVVPASGRPEAVPHSADDLAEVVAKRLNPDEPVIVDGSADLAARLRACGYAASAADSCRLRETAAAWCDDEPDAADSGPTARRSPRIGALLTGAAATVAVTAAVIARPADPPTAATTRPLVEGRVAMTVPARWSVHRVTAGPGSARAEAVSPDDAHTAIHLTQAPVPVAFTLADVADGLRVALADQPAGVFVDFDADAERAQRRVVAYREIRSGHEIDWAVWADRGVRIGVGCQSAPGRGESVRLACDDAVRSAHTVA
jgi:type VII secretion-associated protein (TIGR03931 family)